jgi:hypothetical protein
VSESNAHGHDDTDLRLRSCIQITLFGVASGGHLGNQIAEHIRLRSGESAMPAVFGRPAVQPGAGHDLRPCRVLP